MSILLDTSYLYASEVDTERNFKRAFGIREKIKNNEYGRIYITDYIFDEFVTLLLARSFQHEVIKKLGNALLNSERIIRLSIDKYAFNKAWLIFNQYKDLSFTDCTTIALADTLRIKNIASFDSGFDRVKTIKRIF